MITEKLNQISNKCCLKEALTSLQIKSLFSHMVNESADLESYDWILHGFEACELGLYLKTLISKFSFAVTHLVVVESILQLQQAVPERIKRK